MLYLFNSGYRPLYVTNVLNTLALPSGYNNEYRYKHSGESRQISPAFYSALPALRSGLDCVIVFIDRFGPQGYVYHPLRFGKFVSYRDVNDYIHFRVKLGNFVYPRNVQDFTRDLSQALQSQGIPRLTDNDPKNTRDGNYAIDADTIVGSVDSYQTGEDAWNSAVEQLSTVPSLATSDTQSPIFLRLDVYDRTARENVVPESRDLATLLPLKKNFPYDLVVTYRYRRQRTDQTAKERIEVAFGDGLKGQTSLTVDTHANSVPMSFSTKRYVEEARGYISFTAVRENGKPEVLITDRPLEYELAEAKGFWGQVIIALLLFSILSALIGIDLTKVQPLTMMALIHVAWPKILLGLFQTFVLFWLFRLIGKKLF